MIEEGGGFKFFQLPSGFTPTGLVHHSTTSTAYIVGNEVCTVEPVYGGHCGRQPSPYYSHLVQAPSG